MEIGWDRGGKGFLRESVGLEAIEDILVELVGIDLVGCLMIGFNDVMRNDGVNCLLESAGR